MKIKIHILCSVTSFQKLCCSWDVGKCGIARQAIDAGYLRLHRLWLCNTCCFPTLTKVAQMCHCTYMVCHILLCVHMMCAHFTVQWTCQQDNMHKYHNLLMSPQKHICPFFVLHILSVFSYVPVEVWRCLVSYGPVKKGCNSVPVKSYSRQNACLL